MWNLIVAYVLIAVVLAAYLASIVWRTRKANQTLEAEQA